MIKSCYNEVWAELESRRDGLLAGIKALSEKKEMLGEELVRHWDAIRATNPLTLLSNHFKSRPSMSLSR